MKHEKVLYFDMDGTIADLYGFANWLYLLQNKKPIFTQLEKMPWFDECIPLIQTLKEKFGYKVGIITWTPMDTTPEYEAQARKDKNIWLGENAEGLFDFVVFQRYGTPKHLSMLDNQEGLNILFDDNGEIRADWNETSHSAFDANVMVQVLKALIIIETNNK